MTNIDIQKSRQLLKHLDEQMIFLRDILSQVNNLSNQVSFVSSDLKQTWISIEKLHVEYNKETK
jgi:hypothetical protein